MVFCVKWIITKNHYQWMQIAIYILELFVMKRICG
jgi:hypothetical protein